MPGKRRLHVFLPAKLSVSGLRKVLDYGSAPTAPQNVVASSNDATVTVTFSASDSFTPISLYRVYVDGVLAGTTTTSPYVQDNVTNGTKTYSVTAVNSVGESAAGVASPITVTVTPPAPGAPVYNAITIVSTSALDHSWTASTTGGSTTSYTLDRSLTGTGGWTNRYTGSATSFSDTGLSTGTQYFYRLLAFNTTVPSVTYSTRNATTLTSSTVNANFGNWWQITRSGNQLVQSHRIGTLYPQLFTNGNSAWKGIAVEYRWSDFETTQGNVAAGLALIRAELAALRTYNPVRKLVIQYREERRNTTYANRNTMYPPYLSDSLNAVYTFGSTTLGTTFQSIGWVWTNSAAHTAHVNMWTALINGLKTNATDWAQIEGFRPVHECNNQAYGPSDSSSPVSFNPTSTQYQTEVQSFTSLIRSLAPDKMIWINCTEGLNNKIAFLNFLEPLYVLCGHGDTLPRGANGTSSNGSGADRELTGTLPNNLNTTIDRRVSSAIVMAVEGSELGQGAFQTYTPQELWDYNNDTMQARYIFWQTYTGNSSDPLASNIAAIKAFGQANPVLDNTGIPATYP